MTVNLDTSTAIRSNARYRELVTAVYGAPASAQETQWVEWKREGDAQYKKWRAEMAKQILGMANRDPDVASTWCGGCAYVLLGVSPGHLNGSPVHDASKIDSWLTPYVGRAPNAPEWNSSYVELEGKHILVLTIEPPKCGDRIWVCHREFLADPKAPGYDPQVALRDGGIYVRHKASTEEANSADVEMLQRRLAGARRRISGTSLLLSPDSRAVAVDAKDHTVAAWAEREREEIKPPPPPPPKPEGRTIKVSDLPADSSLAATAKMLSDLGGTLNSSLMSKTFFEPDTRTREDHQKEVEAYIAKATKAMSAFVLRRTFERGLGRIALFVRNDTDDPIRQLRVELYIAVHGVMAFDYGDVPDVDLPKRPIMLGKGGRSRFGALDAISLSGLRVPRYDYLSSAIQPIGRGVKIDNSGSVRLTFDPLDLYPRETADLAEIQLFTRADLAGTILAAEWTARSRDASGVLPGRIEIPVDPKVPTIEELLAEPEEQDEDEDDGDA